MNTVTVNDIFGFLNEKFPVTDAAEFDNAGFLVGDGEAKVEKALVTLDCDLSAIKTAAETDCNLIISHHPVIFGGLKNCKSGSVVYELIRKGISVSSMHTNLDVGRGGVNDCLCERLGLTDTTPVKAHDGFCVRIGNISPCSADRLAEIIGESLNVRVKYTPCSHTVSKVLVCSGSGGEFLQDAADFDCDALITADVKHNVFIETQLYDIAVYDAGHFNTEDVVVEPLAEILKAKYRGIEFICSHNTSIKYL